VAIDDKRLERIQLHFASSPFFLPITRLPTAYYLRRLVSSPQEASNSPRLPLKYQTMPQVQYKQSDAGQLASRMKAKASGLTKDQ
jgi:hypothetical protein